MSVPKKGWCGVVGLPVGESKLMQEVSMSSVMLV